MKRPSFQFYPGDFFRDPGVRAISFAARGLWTDMLCLMHESDRRGYLQLNGKPVNAEQLARMTGGSTDEVSRLLQELDNSGVFSRTEHGVMYSRRMVRDERKRELCSDAGKRGGGNPTFRGHPKGVPKGRRKGEAKASSSSSTSVTEANASAPPNPPSGGRSRKLPAFGIDDVTFPDGMETPAVKAAVESWISYKRSRGKGYRSVNGVDILIRKWLMPGPAAFVDAIENSIANNYDGVHAGGPRTSESGQHRRETPGQARERANVAAFREFLADEPVQQGIVLEVDGGARRIEANGGIHAGGTEGVARGAGDVPF